MFVDGADIDIQIELPAHTMYDCGQRLDAGKLNGDAQTLAFWQMLDRNRAELTVKLDDTVIDTIGNHLHAWDRASLEKAQHRVPIVRRPVAQLKHRAGVCCHDTRSATQC